MIEWCMYICVIWLSKNVDVCIDYVLLWRWGVCDILVEPWANQCAYSMLVSPGKPALRLHGRHSEFCQLQRQQGTGYTMMTVKRRALFCICNEHKQWFLYTLHTLPMHFPFVTHLPEILSLTQQLTMAIFEVQGRKSANGWHLKVIFFSEFLICSSQFKASFHEHFLILNDFKQ